DPGEPTDPLQWGRDHLVAETSRVSSGCGRDGAASMGPRPSGRGNRAWVGQLQVHHVGASMGPRPSGRGNYALAAGISQASATLQWGRDHLVAETWRAHAQTAGSRRCFNGAATIWSRKPDRLDRGVDELVPLASMGPRPSGRGNPREEVCVSWRSSRFNGAATIWSRKPASCTRAATRAARFNGAATIWSRKPRGRRTGTGPCASFNGAATIWSRKPSGTADAVIDGYLASMGPRPSGRGNTWVTGEYVPAWKLLQWGRDHLVAETNAAGGAGSPVQALQWGRDHLVAETATDDVAGVHYQRVLQWGRDH